MTESEMIFRLAARYPQLVVKDAEVAVNAILEAMITCLVMGQRIEIRGFGSFGINYRPPRTGRNPKSADADHGLIHGGVPASRAATILHVTD
jgi:integration host factor subunit beta